MMAFASVGQFIASSSKAGASASVTVLASTSNLTIGRLGIVIVAKDNASTSDGNTSEVTSITDEAGNTYAKLREFCNSQGAGNAGATVSVWYTIATANLASGDDVTINFSSSITAKAVVGWVFSLAAGSTISVTGTDVVDQADDGADASSMSLSGLSSKERIWLRGIAEENFGTATITPTSGYTDIPLSGTGGGLNTANMCSCGEFKIATATGETSDPTTAAFDQASVFMGIEEILAGGSGTKFLTLLGVGN